MKRVLFCAFGSTIILLVAPAGADAQVAAPTAPSAPSPLSLTDTAPVMAHHHHHHHHHHHRHHHHRRHHHRLK